MNVPVNDRSRCHDGSFADRDPAQYHDATRYPDAVTDADGTQPTLEPGGLCVMVSRDEQRVTGNDDVPPNRNAPAAIELAEATDMTVTCDRDLICRNYLRAAKQIRIDAGPQSESAQIREAYSVVGHIGNQPVVQQLAYVRSRRQTEATEVAAGLAMGLTEQWRHGNAA